jgi:hypothetical protein
MKRSRGIFALSDPYRWSSWGHSDIPFQQVAMQPCSQNRTIHPVAGSSKKVKIK